MPKKPEPTLLLELKHSRRLSQLLLVIHLLALASSLANVLPLVVKTALVTGICIHFWFMCKNEKNRHFKIKHAEGTGWELENDKNFESIDIARSTVITTFAIFLQFKQKNIKQSLLIVKDMLNEDDYRRLIVRLKTTGKQKNTSE